MAKEPLYFQFIGVEGLAKKCHPKVICRTSNPDPQGEREEAQYPGHPDPGGKTPRRSGEPSIPRKGPFACRDSKGGWPTWEKEGVPRGEHTFHFKAGG